MPIHIETLKRYNYNPVFMETGTDKGNGVKLAIETGFKLICSIEGDQEKAQKNIEEFKDNPFVKILHGNSEDMLRELLGIITKPITFWLDAHPCEGYSKGTPILQELSAIYDSGVKDHTILVDDMLYYRKSAWRVSENSARRVSDKDIIDAMRIINSDYNIYFVNGQYVEDDILVAEYGRN